MSDTVSVSPDRRLRRAVQDAVEGSSLRQVAKHVGMSPSGLRKFLDGAQPYSATRRKLEGWYSRSGHGTTAAGALQSLETLVGDLPPTDRHRAKQRIAHTVSEQYLRSKGEQPEWLEVLEKHLEE